MSIIFIHIGMLIFCQTITLPFLIKKHNQPTGLFKTCKVAPLLKKRLRTKEKKNRIGNDGTV